MEFISSPFPSFCLQLSSNMYVLGFFGTFGAFRVAAIGFQVCQALCEKEFRRLGKVDVRRQGKESVSGTGPPRPQRFLLEYNV
ncbi:hypothetical protein B0H12DRAFT_1106056, partial [Mycena haematopus]